MEKQTKNGIMEEQKKKQIHKLFLWPEYQRYETLQEKTTKKDKSEC